MKEPKHSLSGFETYFATPGAGKTILSFKKNAVIYSQGDPAESIFYIQKGRVKLHVVSEHGKEAVVAIMEAGQFFGEGCLNGRYCSRCDRSIAGRQRNSLDIETCHA